MRQKRLLYSITFIVCAFALRATAQVNTSVSNPLPEDSIAAIANKGMPYGMEIHELAKPASLYHYPLPDEVMAYRKQLQLDNTQLGKLNAIIEALNLKKLEISQSVTRNEKALNQLFSGHQLNDGSLIFFGNRYGLYEGEMRTAVLMACYQTRQVLMPKQLTKFEQIKYHIN